MFEISCKIDGQYATTPLLQRRLRPIAHRGISPPAHPVRRPRDTHALSELERHPRHRELHTWTRRADQSYRCVHHRRNFSSASVSLSQNRRGRRRHRRPRRCCDFLSRPKNHSIFHRHWYVRSLFAYYLYIICTLFISISEDHWASPSSLARRSWKTRETINIHYNI